jgi:hypothetical protein
VPVLFRILAAADALAGGVGLLDCPLSAERLVATAQRSSGLREFGETQFMEPLRRFLSACATEAKLSVVGRFATRWDTLRFVSNLLRLQAEEERSQDILHERIERPIFITGLPRSGTTFLHRLLLEDSFNRAPLVWQTIYPYPPFPTEQCVSKVSVLLRNFERMTPEIRGLHPLEADSPQECSEIAAHVFRSLRFDTTYRIPSYRRWLDADGYLPAYLFEKRFLQHLQYRKQPGRWVLKCPDHLFALGELREAFPDACAVFVHRDPLSVLLSVAKLTEVLRKPFTRQVDPLEIGRAESARWLAGAECMLRAAHDEPFAQPICHVGYAELVSDPAATIARVYRHFGLELNEQAHSRIASKARHQPDGGYSHPAYLGKDHGLDRDAEQEKFAGYMSYFGIEPENISPGL